MPSVVKGRGKRTPVAVRRGIRATSPTGRHARPKIAAPPALERLSPIIPRVPIAGEPFAFTYPRRNRLNTRVELEERWVRVLRVDDASRVPITLGSFLRRPRVRRGRWRFWGYDPSKFASEVFYWDWWAAPPLQLVIFDLATGVIQDWFGEACPQTDEGIADLIAIGHEIRKRPLDYVNEAALGICTTKERGG